MAKNAMFNLRDYTTADILNTPVRRGGILPVTEYPDRTEFDISSGLTGALMDAFTAPARAARGEISEAEQIPEAFNFAGSLTLGSLLAPRPTGSVGMGGRAAKEALEAQQPQGIRAFHGSPHDFDRFSMDAIGTGEGAQAYGHGLYFAEAEDVARSYRENLTRGVRTGSGTGRIDVFTVDGAEVPASQKSVADIAHTMREYSIDPNTADGLDWLQREVGARGLPFETIEQAANLYKRDITRNTVDGRMYEVNIKADQQDFLDWDKPLSEQSEKVRNAVLGSGLAKTPFGSIDTVKRLLARERGLLQEAEQELSANRGMFGRSKLSTDQRDYYARQIEDSKARIDEFERILSGDATASYLVPQGGDTAAQFSSAMRDAGIPGIRYLDQMSRGTGEGSSNYVVFDDALVEILRKYGLLPPVAAGGLAAALGQEDELY